MQSISRREFLSYASLAGAVAGQLNQPNIAQAASPISGPKTRVGLHQGRPHFFIDGQPFSQPVFETYVPSTKYFQQFADAGTKVFGFSVNLGPGFGPEVWRGPDNFDFTKFDEVAHRILDVQPAALLMPRIYVTTPSWWVDGHSNECQRFFDGTTKYSDGVGHGRDQKAFPSLASVQWREETAQALQQLISHTLTSDYRDHIFGYVITGLMSEEWYHWSIHTGQLSDYSVHAVKAFQQWLRNKYESSEALQESWNQKDLSFEAVTIPSPEVRQQGRDRTFRNPRSEMSVIDWYLFYNDLVPDTMEVFLRAAKNASGGTKVVGAFYCYMFEFGGDPEYGHNALSRLLRSPNLDFVAVTASYFDRHLGRGADYARSPITSVARHGKLWYHDNDTVSFRYDEINKSRTDREVVERYRKELGVTESPQESIWQYQRSAGFVLGQGIYQSFFDLHGGYFDDPQLMKEVERLNRALERSANHDTSSVAEILVISDEVSCSYATFESPFLQQSLQPAQVQFTKIGAPHDSILVDDLGDADLDRYKFVIFLNCFHLSAKQRQQIERDVLRKGRTVLWCYATGLFENNNESINRLRSLTRFHLASHPARGRVQALLELSDEARSLFEVANSQSPPMNESPVGHPHIWLDLLAVEDPTAIPLGRLAGNKDVAFAMKALDDWTSVYTLNPVLPASILAGLARRAGVHLYSDRNDTLYASRQYLTINADGKGVRDISFPRPVTLIDPFTDELISRRTKQIHRPMLDKETWIVRLSEE
ncbi:beta-galactosidase [bacterium]|nr:beta-galactosidase [bacterium]